MLCKYYLNEAGVAILISEQVNFRTEKLLGPKGSIYNNKNDQQARKIQ